MAEAKRTRISYQYKGSYNNKGGIMEEMDGKIDWTHIRCPLRFEGAEKELELEVFLFSALFTFFFNCVYIFI